MRMFKRRRPDPPQWAAFFDADEWEAFVPLVREDAERRGWVPRPEEGTVAEGGADGLVMGLGNLAQICHTAPRDAWPDIVRHHFTTLAEGGGDIFTGPEQARAAMKLRLFHREWVAGPGWHGLERPLAGGDLRLILAYDLPTTVKLPSREDVLEWGDEDELFELALEQTRAEPGLELSRHELANQGDAEPTPIWTLAGDSFFTATHILWADDFDPPPSEHGTLVAVPHRHVVLAHPIRDTSVIAAVPHLLQLGHRMWVQGPGSISPSVYWLRDGVHERLEAWVNDDGGTTFAPSDEFTDMLNRLEQ
jgi:hypothetical protein